MALVVRWEADISFAGGTPFVEIVVEEFFRCLLFESGSQVHERLGVLLSLSEDIN